MSYKFEKAYEVNGLPVYKFDGPGLGSYARMQLLNNEIQAESIARMLAKAFEAGRQAKASEIRNVLGVHGTPWGVKLG